MKMALQWNRNVVLGLALAIALLVGLWLRLHLLAEQVLIDDEWHGLYYVIGKSPTWLLTHFSIPGATCIPLNFYTWLLGTTIGWSELSLRLPSVAGGTLCVVAGPFLAQRLIGPRRAVLLGVLLAISPLLIFYSRICRPYSLVALLGFAALLLAAQWQRTGGVRLGVLFVITGALAIYFHLFAAVTVGAPILMALVYHGWCRFKGIVPERTNGPSWRQWCWAALAISVISAALVLPALIHSLQSTFFTIALTGRLSLEALPKMAQLISGTRQPVLMGLFWIVVIVGAVELCRKNPRFGWLLVSLYPLHALALVLSRPDCAQSGIVLTRYCIPLVPASLLLAACGIQATQEYIAARTPFRPLLQSLSAGAIVLALAMTGPLPQCYVSPNNFTSHGAYQHDFRTIDWQRSFASDLTPADFKVITTVRADELSPFYQWLANHPGDRPIVEYPMMIGDHFNPLYYYQHFHRRPVLVGYATDVSLWLGLAAGNVYGNTYIDQVLSLTRESIQLRFRKLVETDDVAGMRRSGVEFIVLHKRFEAQLPDVSLPLPDLERLDKKYRQTLGTPFYEDALITVFRF